MSPIRGIALLVLDHHSGLRPDGQAGGSVPDRGDSVGTWSGSVKRGDSVFAITAEPGSNEATFEVTQPFRADLDTLEEIRLLIGSAIGTAQSEQP